MDRREHLTYDPFDPVQVDDQDGVLADLRRESPVTEIRPGMFYLSRHEDIIAVCRSPELFVQARFRPLEDDTRSPDQLNLGETDPPLHTQVRKIFAGALNPPAARKHQSFIRDVSVELVDAFADRGHADLVGDLGGPLTARVAARLAGLPEDDAEILRRYSGDYLTAHDASADPAQRELAAARVGSFETHLRTLIAQRQAMAERPDDLLSALVAHVNDDGTSLPAEKILTHLSKDVVSAGIETTTHLIANFFYDVVSRPGAYGDLRADRSLIPNAVEESLRFRGPVQILFRRAVRATTIRGVVVPAGSTVALGYASANHDESVFASPDDFDIRRGPEVRRHFGFGWGIHLCVGAPLARIEAIEAINAVLDRIPRMQLADGFEYRRVQMFIMRGPVRLDVIF